MANKNMTEDNFERLKKQMIQKRDRAEHLPEGEEKKTSNNVDTNVNKNTSVNNDGDTSVNTNTNVNNDGDTSVNKDTNVNEDINTCTDKNVNNSTNSDVINYTNVNVNKSVNNDTNKNIYKNVYKDENTNAFILNFNKKEDVIKRQTYYIKESTIDKIDRIAESSGIGKSELVQKILEEALKSIKIVRS